MENMIINFDMDGTIADLYGVDGWLTDLINEDTRPYDVAKPLVNMNTLAKVLNEKIKKGYIINIISWTSKNGTEEYNARVEEAKKAWLAKHLKSVKFNNIMIVKYGTPKHTLANGYLFDDEKANRDNWGVGAYDVNNIIETLKKI